MKKNNLLKIFGIMFLFVLVLSWLIPAGSAGTTEPIGIVNLFRLPVLTFQTFIQYFIAFVAIGAFYGVLNKTGVYAKFVEKQVKTWSNKPRLFLFLTAIFFVLVSALMGTPMFLFLFVPFFAAILISLGYSNMTALMVTVGAMLVGQVGCVYGFNIAGYYVNVLGIKINTAILSRVILFVISLGVYLFFISKIKLDKTKKVTKRVTKEEKTTKKVTKEDTKKTTKKVVKKDTIEEVKTEKVITLLSNEKSNKSVIPFICIMVLTLVLCFIGMYNWHYSFGIELFDNLDTKLQAITIGSYTIVANILKGVTILGYWGNYEFVITLFIASALLGWLYNVKLSDYVDGLKDGAKQMLVPAFYATMANVVFTYLLTCQNGTFVDTINGWCGNISESFNIVSTTLISLVSGLFYNDYYYAITSASAIFTNYKASTLGLTGILSGAIYSLLMLLLPTSVYLVAGLKYFDVSLKDWFKNIWKYALIMFIAVILLVICVFAIM